MVMGRSQRIHPFTVKELQKVVHLATTFCNSLTFGDRHSNESFFNMNEKFGEKISMRMMLLLQISPKMSQHFTWQ
jgi:hypothetical protein